IRKSGYIVCQNQEVRVHRYEKKRLKNSSIDSGSDSDIPEKKRLKLNTGNNESKKNTRISDSNASDATKNDKSRKSSTRSNAFEIQDSDDEENQEEGNGRKSNEYKKRSNNDSLSKGINIPCQTSVT
ncbi:hypothetical protein M1146_07605, partial [Patescibacteria group bacterium]|nr:hypothetical protein [Patescibacteria group bacterium]